MFHKLKLRPMPFYEISLMGYSIRFFNYIQLITLYEEIFVFEVYKFTTHKANPIILDCGSNIGLFLVYAKMICPSARIIAFEPDRETYLLSLENIRINNFEHVVCHNVALADHEGAETLFKSSLSGSPGMSLVQSDQPIQESVNTKKLSMFVNEPVDLLKVDVEGSEPAILNDLVETGKIEFIQQMVIEFHPLKIKEGLEFHVDRLNSLNFTGKEIQGSHQESSDRIFFFRR